MATLTEVALPEEMLSFVLRHGEFSKAGLRLGRLAIKGRTPIPTPNFLVSTSRGIVPHVAQDVVSKLTRIPAAYIGLEDFIEKTPQKAPILLQPSSKSCSKLRDFIALPSDCISVLGPRRVPALDCPKQSTNTAISISTSVGFRSLELDDYVKCVSELQPDIAVSLADVVTTKAISQKRLEKSADRTHAWMRDTSTARSEDPGSQRPLFASVPPLESHQHSLYLGDLAEDYKNEIAGLSFLSPETATSLRKDLEPLPRLCLSNPNSPQEILRAITLGNDLITVPLVTGTSENGIAMTFSIDNIPEGQNLSLGFDLWSTSHMTDLSPLLPGCQCYTCTKHHRAYLHHLLSAKEMLAWTLLQIHNFYHIDIFFQQIRNAIEAGTFEAKAEAFNRAYDSEMPESSGQGPRTRGYQAKSVGGGEPRRNEKAYGHLDEQARKLEEAESGIATPEAELDALDLQEQGLGEVQK